MKRTQILAAIAMVVVGAAVIFAQAPNQSKTQSKGKAPAKAPTRPSTSKASAQTAAYKAPRTPWGHPDLQGTYTVDDLQGVPMERPKELGTRRFLTEQELKERAASVDRPKEGFWARVQGLGKVEAEAVLPNFVEYARDPRGKRSRHNARLL